jgi:NTE family protein
MFHLGVLQGLGDVGIDSSGIELMIGTSAGSAVAAATRAGAGLAEIAAALLEPPSEEARRELTVAIGEVRYDLWERVRPLSPRLALEVLPGGNGLGLAACGLLPAGLVPTSTLSMLPGVDDFDEWPNGLWIPAVDSRTGEVVVFGRDRIDVSVPEALEASSAVPAMFRPKHIDGVDFVDGAAASSTHAGLAAEIEPDLVVVSSVQTRPGVRPIRIAARRRLNAELASLSLRDVPYLVIGLDREANERAAGFGYRSKKSSEAIIADGRRLTRSAFAEQQPKTAS